jgi:hypothetical protein
MTASHHTRSLDIVAGVQRDVPNDGYGRNKELTSYLVRAGRAIYRKQATGKLLSEFIWHDDWGMKSGREGGICPLSYPKLLFDF